MPPTQPQVRPLAQPKPLPKTSPRWRRRRSRSAYRHQRPQGSIFRATLPWLASRRSTRLRGSCATPSFQDYKGTDDLRAEEC